MELTAVRFEDGVRVVDFVQNTKMEHSVVPYVFCVSRKPISRKGEVLLKDALGSEYDAWYKIRNAAALGKELEKAVKGWLFDNEISNHRITKRHGWVSYYEGTTPNSITDVGKDDWSEAVAKHLMTMQGWFEKGMKFQGQTEYRYAYLIESPQLPVLPEYIDLELTVRGIKLFEPVSDFGKIETKETKQ